MRGGTLYKTQHNEKYTKPLYTYIYIQLRASSEEDWRIDLEVKDIDININFWCCDIWWHQALLVRNSEIDLQMSDPQDLFLQYRK